MPPDPICDRSLIVCATPRSGSSFLSESLGHLGIGDPNEWLRIESINFANKEAGLPPNTPIRQTIRRIMKERVHNRIFSVKIMWDNLTFLLQRLKEDEPDKADYTIDDWLLDLFPSPKLIYLQRNDHIAQAVSLAKAHLSNIWSSSKKKDIDPYTVCFNFGLIHQQIRFLDSRNELWQQALTQTRIPWFQLNYESFIEDYEGTLTAIAHFWGIERPPFVDPTQMEQARMSDGINKRWIQRYEQLLAEARPKFSPTRSQPIPPRDVSGTIIPNRKKIVAHRKERGYLAVTLTNQGMISWPNIAQENLHGSVALQGQLIEIERQKVLDQSIGYLPHDLDPNASAIIELAILTPNTCGEYTLSLSLIQEGIGPLSNPQCPSVEVELQIIPTFEERAMELKFPHSEPTTWNWRHDPVFGDFRGNEYPWIFHQELGWIYAPGTDPLHHWIYDTQLGLLYTTPADFPYFYSDNLKTWIEYERHSKSPRRFTRLDNEEVIEVKFFG